MLQINPDPVERIWPTLGLGVGPGETIDYPDRLPGVNPVDQAADEPRTEAAEPTSEPEDEAAERPGRRRPRSV